MELYQSLRYLLIWIDLMGQFDRVMYNKLIFILLSIEIDRCHGNVTCHDVPHLLSRDFIRPVYISCCLLMPTFLEIPLISIKARQLDFYLFISSVLC